MEKLKKKSKVVIVDDHMVFRNGLKLVLSKFRDIKLVGEASNGDIFLQILKDKKVDLVFMDINMPVMDGFEACQIALSMMPNIKIIVLTTFGENEFFSRMIQLEISGYMLKNSNINDFRMAIDKVMNGGNYYSEQLLVNITKDLYLITENEDKHDRLPQLSKREAEVLNLVCKGFSNDKIGKELHISCRTVEKHKTNLLNKTETKNTTNLVIYAFKKEIVKF